MSDLWETPAEVFDPLNCEFNFSLDVCATPKTTKVAHSFITKEENSLEVSWIGRTSRNVFWMNPPYSDILPWVKKAWETAQKGGLVVALLPCHTDRKWFHDYVYNKAEIRFIKGRVAFLLDGKKRGRNPGLNLVAIWRPKP